jgi:poly-gamma-glutamate capsule biosynthesis protein CapA/YwtB (metallophosphatase superfamily)
VRAVCALVAAIAAPAWVAPPAAAVTIAWGGDVTLGSSYGQPPARGWPQLAPVARVLRSADLAAVNYEGTFAPGGASKCGGSGRDNCFAFQAPRANAGTLARAGVDIVNLANNHAFDFGPAGYRGTRAALDRARVRATGAPGEIRVLRADGVKVAFVGFSSYPWSAPLNDPGRMTRLVRAAGRRADIAVVFFHGGAEGSDKLRVPYRREYAFGEDRGHLRQFARRAVRAGADLVLGSGPHVLRGMQRYRGRLIAYSLGNLTGWKNFSTAGTLSYSAVLTAELGPRGVLAGGRVTSLRLNGIGVPRIDRTNGAARLMRRLSRSDFGRTGVWFTRRGLPRRSMIHRQVGRRNPPAAPESP